MRKLIFLLPFLSTAALAQQPANPALQGLTDDWLIVQGGLKHVATDIDAIVKDAQVARAEADTLKTENERLKKLLEEKSK